MMDIDYTALGAWIAVLGLIVTIIALILETRGSRFSLGVDLILKLEERFNGEELRKARQNAAKGFMNKTYTDADDVLDFFETVGMLTKRGALDEQMVWSSFSHWTYHYWHSFKQYIRDTQKETPTVWSYFSYLHKRMITVDRRETRNSEYEQEPAEEDLKDFFQCESTV